MNLRLSFVLAALLVAGCASTGGIPVGGASYQDSVDFSRFQTFDFLPVPAGAARIAATLDYFEVEGVLARDLGGIGLARQMGGRPDVLVNYFQGGRQVDLAAWGYGTAGNPVIAVIDVPATCLVVDVIDASRRILVWRGIATDALVSPDAIDPAVRQMLQAWPAPQGR
jgi:hypothetical protein